MGVLEQVSGIGVRHVRVALRDDDGTIQVAAGTPIGTAYNGLRVSGATALTVTLAEATRVPVPGDDRIFWTWQLAPTENATGELRVNKRDNNVIQLVTGTNQWGSPDRRKIGLGTDVQGEEPNVIIWGCRQIIEADESQPSFGQKKWETYFFPNALCYVNPATMEYQTISEWRYVLVANDATVDQLGQALTSGVHGFTTAEMFVISTDEKYMLDAFLGDGAQTDFTLSQTPYESGVFEITLDGVVQTQTTHWTRAGAVISMVAAPAADAKLLVEYEYE